MPTERRGLLMGATLNRRSIDGRADMDVIALALAVYAAASSEVDLGFYSVVSVGLLLMLLSRLG